MTAEGHIQQVWTGVHSSERLYRYYGRLESKLQRRHVASLVFIGVASSGAAAALLGHLPDFISAILFFLVAGATIWMFTADYSKRSAIAGLASGQWMELALEWKRLWYDLDDLEDEEIVRRMLALQQRERLVGAEAQSGRMMMASTKGAPRKPTQSSRRSFRRECSEDRDRTQRATSYP